MALPKPNILVADDNLDGREMLAEYLMFRGFSVVQANNGAEALTVARARSPRVILMDLSMPGIDGWNATRQLKADPRTKDIIVIALTAHALEPDQAEALGAGCDAFISKPYDLALLADALEKLVRRGRAALGAVSAIMQPEMRPTRSAVGS